MFLCAIGTLEFPDDSVPRFGGSVSVAELGLPPSVAGWIQGIRDHYLETGVQVGMKPAGGIRDAKLALHYLVLVAETLGSDWLDPHWFRFGASSLANDLIRQLLRREDELCNAAKGHHHHFVFGVNKGLDCGEEKR